MKIKLPLFVMVLITCYSFYSCEDIVEKDLTKQWVYAITPEDFSSSDAVTQMFKWKEVKGADSYNLQIFKTDTSYTKIYEFIADTNVVGTQYILGLKSGCYKWQIFAQNSASRSGVSEFRFQIDTSSDLDKQKVFLISPINNRTTDTLKQTFKWGAIPAATTYNFQLFEVGNNTAITSELIDAPSTSYTYTFPETGGVYNWSVTATNGVSSTAPTTFKLVIDTSGVPVPNLVSPINDTLTVIGNYVPLQWSSVKNVTAYFVQVSKDKTQMDTTATIANPLVTYCNYYNATLNIKYYWRVKAIRGGRESNFSNWVSFKRH